MAETDIVAFRSQITPEDIRALTRVANRLSSSMRLRFGLALVVVLWLVLFLAVLSAITTWLFGEDDDLLSIWFPLLVGVPILIVAIRWYMRFTERNAIDPRSALAQGYDVEAGPNGLHLHNEQFETLYRWPAILLVRQTNTHVFLFIDRRLAVVVARRFFPSDDAFTQFLAIVRKYSNPAAL